MCPWKGLLRLGTEVILSFDIDVDVDVDQKTDLVQSYVHILPLTISAAVHPHPTVRKQHIIALCPKWPTFSLLELHSPASASKQDPKRSDDRAQVYSVTIRSSHTAPLAARSVVDRSCQLISVLVNVGLLHRICVVVFLPFPQVAIAHAKPWYIPAPSVRSIEGSETPKNVTTSRGRGRNTFFFFFFGCHELIFQSVVG